jgi:hypothetical protein
MVIAFIIICFLYNNYFTLSISAADGVHIIKYF